MDPFNGGCFEFIRLKSCPWDESVPNVLHTHTPSTYTQANDKAPAKKQDEKACATVIDNAPHAAAAHLLSLPSIVVVAAVSRNGSPALLCQDVMSRLDAPPLLVYYGSQGRFFYSVSFLSFCAPFALLGTSPFLVTRSTFFRMASL